jgi:hypothetical protein
MEEFFTVMIRKPEYEAPSVPVAYAISRLWQSGVTLNAPQEKWHVVAADNVAKYAEVGEYEWVAQVREYTDDVMEFEGRMQMLGWDVFVG